MDEILEYLKTNQTYFLTTVDAEGNPQVRPFGTIAKFEDALYIQTGRVKDVYKQIKAHSRCAISAMGADGTWLRIQADIVEDDRIEAETAVMAEYPSLAAMYTPGDGNCCVLKLNIVSATIDSFTAPRKTLV